jgi:hypothetical protein
MPLPSFIISGQRRSGTTSLTAKLDAHPDVFLHRKRDSGWFVDEQVRFGEGPDWDESHSPGAYSDWFAAAGMEGEKRVGEKSAGYLYHKPCHARIATCLPDALHIVSLRHPIDRAWSHYWNEVGKARETLSFTRLQELLGRSFDIWKRQRRGTGMSFARSLRRTWNRLRAARSPAGAYRFAVRDRSGVNDLELVQRMLSTETFRRIAVPQELPVDELRRLLILAPHQEDEVIGAGGLCLRARDSGVELTIGFLTDGAQTGLGPPDGQPLRPENVVALRRAEAERVYQALVERFYFGNFGRCSAGKRKLAEAMLRLHVELAGKGS